MLQTEMPASEENYFEAGLSCDKHKLFVPDATRGIQIIRPKRKV